MCFLRVYGLTTLAHRDQLLHQKRRKRRRMLRERSISPPAVRGKRKTSPPPVAPTPTLSTILTPEEMNCSPHLEDKKHFLNMFSLSHVTNQQRRGNIHYTNPYTLHPSSYSPTPNHYTLVYCNAISQGYSNLALRGFLFYMIIHWCPRSKSVFILTPRPIPRPPHTPSFSR